MNTDVILKIREAIGMREVKVLLAGESWMTTLSHVKGFNQFFTAEYQTGIGGLQNALADSEINLTHLPGHLVPTEFPSSLEAMSAYDVIVLSDVGADSLLLHPDTMVRSLRTPNRLKLIAEWVAGGGGFMMIGGYYTFQGIQGAARYHRTPVEDVLPVTMREYDDRMEMPQGYEPVVVGSGNHPILDGIGNDWPYLLGFNEVSAKPGADVILATGPGEAPPLLVAGKHGSGRTLAWTSDIGPHWLPEAFIDWPGYARLWRQSFAWLAGR
jgi:uncharacterized membrane protein